MIKVWSVNTAGLTRDGAQHDLLLRAEKETVNVLLAQETRFKESSVQPFGQWLRISSGADPSRKTGVAIYVSPKMTGAVVNYLVVTDRLMSISFLTKEGLCVIVNHHAPDETTPASEKDAHWTRLNSLVAAIPPHATILVIGDCNLRWHGRYNSEHDILGPHIFGRGLIYLAANPHANRDLGVEFLRTHSQNFLNSFFRHSAPLKAT